MTAKDKLVSFLEQGEKKAIEFVEAIRALFIEYDNCIQLFGKPLTRKFDADYAYLQYEITKKNMSRPIDNPKPVTEQEFSYRDQQEILKSIRHYNFKKKRIFFSEVMKKAKYKPQ